MHTIILATNHLVIWKLPLCPIISLTIYKSMIFHIREECSTTIVLNKVKPCSTKVKTSIYKNKTKLKKLSWNSIEIKYCCSNKTNSKITIWVIMFRKIRLAQVKCNKMTKNSEMLKRLIKKSEID